MSFSSLSRDFLVRIPHWGELSPNCPSTVAQGDAEFIAEVVHFSFASLFPVVYMWVGDS